MGNLRNQERKFSKRKIPNEILEEIKEKKINDMTNQICYMATQPIPVVEDVRFLPTNQQQERKKHSLEGPSVSIAVEE